MECRGTGKILNKPRNVCKNESILGHCAFMHVYTVPQKHLHKLKLSTTISYMLNTDNSTAN